MKKYKHLSNDVDIMELARNTSQFSGAEIAGLVRMAASFALDRRVSFKLAIASYFFREENHNVSVMLVTNGIS